LKRYEKRDAFLTSRTSITKPTPGYFLAQRFQKDPEFKPADEHILKPAHPEFP